MVDIVAGLKGETTESVGIMGIGVPIIPRDRAVHTHKHRRTLSVMLHKGSVNSTVNFKPVNLFFFKQRHTHTYIHYWVKLGKKRISVLFLCVKTIDSNDDSFFFPFFISLFSFLSICISQVLNQVVFLKFKHWFIYLESIQLSVNFNPRLNESSVHWYSTTGWMDLYWLNLQ